MDKEKNQASREAAEKLIRRVAWISLAVNAGLVVVKFFLSWPIEQELQEERTAREDARD